MTPNGDKYRAQILQVGGFALLTPLGQIYLGLVNLDLDDINLKFIIYLLASFLIGYVGIILFVRGIEILEGSK